MLRAARRPVRPPLTAAAPAAAASPQMQEAYAEANEHAVAAGGSRGHFMVDLCRPGHMTACLRTFQETIGCNDDNWDAHFGAPPADVCVFWKERGGGWGR